MLINVCLLQITNRMPIVEWIFKFHIGSWNFQCGGVLETFENKFKFYLIVKNWCFKTFTPTSNFSSTKLWKSGGPCHNLTTRDNRIKIPHALRDHALALTLNNFDLILFSFFLSVSCLPLKIGMTSKFYYFLKFTLNSKHIHRWK